MRNPSSAMSSFIDQGSRMRQLLPLGLESLAFVLEHGNSGGYYAEHPSL
jgi:hypothetical protein